MLLCLIWGVCLGLTHALEQNYTVQGDEDSYYPNLNFSDTFDWKLLKEFSAKYKNVLLSPVSVKLALALLYQGSNGLTEKEFQNILQFPDKTTVNNDYSQILSRLQASERREYLLNMGTSIFLDSQVPLNPIFESTATQYYKTEVKPVNFTNSVKTSNAINSWVNTITNGKISELVKSGELDRAVMFVANAVYFKGTWRHQFPKNQTYFGKFFVDTTDYTNRSETVTVPYMSTVDTFFMKDSVELDAKILRLPYKGSDYSMFIILPNSLEGLPSLIKKINLYTLSSLLYSMEKRLVEVNIPKFKFDFSSKMGEVLRNFGLHQMFQNSANFSEIPKSNNNLLRTLVVSDIVQKTGIELDEEGSVVYSASGVNIGNKFGEPKEVFHATHPFLFFIEGPSGTVLFNGKIENPLEKESVPIVTRQQLTINSVAAQVFSAPSKESLATTQEQIYPDFSNLQTNSFGSIPNLEPGRPDLETVDSDELLYRYNLFDMELLNVFSESNTNVFLSPASVKTTLAMILEGAVGKCAEEIKEALRITNINQKGVRAVLSGVLKTLKERSDSTYLENSNTIFVSDKHKIYDKYRQTIEQFYGGSINTINFQNVGNAVNSINNWVAKATHDNIREIVGQQSISPQTSAVIVNALYFKGKWASAFDSQVTKTKCFRTENGCTPTAMMRASSNFNYNYIGRLRTHAIQIPYENNFSMLILLPSEEVNVRSIIRDLPHFKIADIIDKLRPVDITLEIPKFTFGYSADLVDSLKSLKIREIFGSRANLSGIVDNGNVLINSLVHKTRIEVDEQGTVAAAATGAIVIPLMGSSSIIVDRPFIFFICHEKTIIFEGILMNPNEQNGAGPAVAQSQNFKVRGRHIK